MEEKKERKKKEEEEEEAGERGERERSVGYRRFNLRAMGLVTIWDSGDTGEVIDYHGTDLSPPPFSLLCPALPLAHPIVRA